MSGVDWRRLNRANWDERVAIHLAAPLYDLARLRSGNARLQPIEDAELGPVAGLRLLHLQCHFGHDTLILAQRDAEVWGLDFSAPAIDPRLGRGTGTERPGTLFPSRPLRRPGRHRRADLVRSGLRHLGAICWLRDIAGWARIAAHFLQPGGSVYLAEGHPAALVLDDAVATPDGRPGFYFPTSTRSRSCWTNRPTMRTARHD